MPDPKEFTCMDDSPLNNGWGYNQRGLDERDEPEEETVDDDCWEDDV